MKQYSKEEIRSLKLKSVVYIKYSDHSISYEGKAKIMDTNYDIFDIRLLHYKKDPFKILNLNWEDDELNEPTHNSNVYIEVYNLNPKNKYQFINETK